FNRQFLHRLLDGFGVEHRAGLRPQLRPQRQWIEDADVRLNLDRPEPIYVTLLDGKGNDEAATDRIELADRGNDPDIGKTVPQVKAAKEIAIGFEAARIVDIVVLDEAQQVRFAGPDRVLQAEVGIGPVADEQDFLNAGLPALVDLEHEVDAVVRQLNDLRLDADVELALAPVDL